MRREKGIVVSACGHDNKIDKIAICLFEGFTNHYNDNKNTNTYCDMLNTLELAGNFWIYAKIVPENTPFSFTMLMPDKFPDIKLKMGGREIQKILREIENQE